MENTKTKKESPIKGKRKFTLTMIIIISLLASIPLFGQNGEMVKVILKTITAVLLIYTSANSAQHISQILKK